MSEIVFILGAGSSQEAGAPLMQNFLNEAKKLCRSNRIDQRYLTDFDQVFDAILKLPIIHSKAQYDLDNIESVFAAFEMAQLIEKLPGKQKEDIDIILKSIKRLIFATLEKAIPFKFKNKNLFPHESHSSFAKLIRDLKSGNNPRKCSIITFNYDLLLDVDLKESGYPADYCLGEVDHLEHTPLMKLHGSLNWSRCQNCKTIVPWYLHDFFKQFYWEFMNKRDENENVYLELASKLSLSEVRHCDKNKPLESEPVIIPPTWNKTNHYQDLSKVWIRAAYELSDAEHIFILGYSLPDSDYFFRCLYALGSVGASRIEHFWVFDPDKENKVQPRFVYIIGQDIKNKFRFEKVPFSKAIKIIREEALGLPSDTGIGMAWVN